MKKYLLFILFIISCSESNNNEIILNSGDLYPSYVGYWYNKYDLYNTYNIEITNTDAYLIYKKQHLKKYYYYWTVDSNYLQLKNFNGFNETFIIIKNNKDTLILKQNNVYQYFTKNVTF